MASHEYWCDWLVFPHTHTGCIFDHQTSRENRSNDSVLAAKFGHYWFPSWTTTEEITSDILPGQSVRYTLANNIIYTEKGDAEVSLSDTIAVSIQSRGQRAIDFVVHGRSSEASATGTGTNHHHTHTTIQKVIIYFVVKFA